MNRNLLIIGAGAYGRVAKEIAESMNVFGKISFVDDNSVGAFLETQVVGKICDLKMLSKDYHNVIVAIGNPDLRLSLIREVESCENFDIPVLVSPFSYVSKSAKIGKGSIVEPMAVIQSECELKRGCIISAGAVVNHGAECHDCVHVDCNAVVLGNVVVPEKTKVYAGMVFPQVAN